MFLENKVNSIFEKVLNKKISNDMGKFLNNLSYVTIGTIISTMVVFFFNIIAGRLLGPSNYGQFTLIKSIATIMSIPMLLGINTAMVKYNSEKIDFIRQRNIISTTYVFVFMFTLISTIIYFLFASQVMNFAHISQDIYFYSIIFAILFASYMLTTNTLQGLHKLKTLSLLRPVYSFVLLVSLFVFLYVGNVSFEAMLFANYIAYVIVCGFIFIIINKYLKFRFVKCCAKKLITYGYLNMFTSISFVLYMNIDKILINKYMLIEDVGIYNAYYNSSVNIVTVLVGIVVTVLFPTISMRSDKKSTLIFFNKCVPYLVVFGLILVTICEYILLKFYGSNYPIDIQLMILFSLTSILFGWYDIYAWIFNSLGIKGVKMTMVGTGSISIVDILLNIYLIPKYGINGAIGATALAYCIGIIVVYIRWKRFSGYSLFSVN
jgi:O-antigen/teichoic acid export membrane protein